MKTKILIATLTLFLLVPISCVLAFEIKTGKDNVNISKEQTIDDNLVTSGQSVTIDGTVNGNVYTGAQNVTINGTINGNVFAGAQNVNITGTINGNVFAGAANVNVTGKVQDDIYAGAGNIEISNLEAKNGMLSGGIIKVDENSKFKEDLLTYGGTIEMNGQVGRDLIASSNSVTIQNKIGRNADVVVGSSLNLKSPTIIEGNFKYTAPNEIKPEQGVEVKGKTDWTPVQQKTQKQEDKKAIIPFLPFTFFGIVTKIIGFIGLLIVSILIAAICKRYTKIFIEKLQTKTWSALGWGFLVLIATPIVILILFIIILGIPIALLLIPMYIILIYFAKVFTCICAGFAILKVLSKKEPYLIWSAILGVIIISILLAIPFLGSLIKLVVLAFGIGGILLALKEYTSHKSKA